MITNEGKIKYVILVLKCFFQKKIHKTKYKLIISIISLLHNSTNINSEINCISLNYVLPKFYNFYFYL